MPKALIGGRGGVSEGRSGVVFGGATLQTRRPGAFIDSPDQRPLRSGTGPDAQARRGRAIPGSQRMKRPIAAQISRRTVLAAALGLVLATGCSSERPAIEPTPTGPVVQIPADFPLDAGWTSDSANGTREAPKGPVTLDLCSAEPWVVPKPVASQRLVLGVDHRYRERLLVLYSNAAGAEAMLDGVVERVEGCTRTMSELGTWLYGDAQRIDDRVHVRRWFEESAFGDEPGCFSMDLYREGNAVLVSEDSGLGIGKSCAERVSEVDARDVAPAVAALQVFDLHDTASDPAKG